MFTPILSTLLGASLLLSAFSAPIRSNPTVDKEGSLAARGFNRDGSYTFRQGENCYQLAKDLGVTVELLEGAGAYVLLISHHFLD